MPSWRNISNLLLIWWFSKDESKSGIKQFLQHQCKVAPEFFSCLVDQEKHPASCHLDTCGWYSYWLKFTFTQTSSHTYKLSHNHHHHQPEVSLLLTTLLTSPALTPPAPPAPPTLSPCHRTAMEYRRLRTFLYRDLLVLSSVWQKKTRFWLIKRLLNYQIHYAEQ